MNQGERTSSRGIRAAIAALALALALSTVVSSLCVTLLDQHDCAGDHCAICLVLDASQAILNAAATPAATAAAGTALAFALAAVTAPHRRLRTAQTPVSTKVMLVI